MFCTTLKCPKNIVRNQICMQKISYVNANTYLYNLYSLRVPLRPPCALSPVFSIIQRVLIIRYHKQNLYNPTIFSHRLLMTNKGKAQSWSWVATSCSHMLKMHAFWGPKISIYKQRFSSSKQRKNAMQRVVFS